MTASRTLPISTISTISTTSQAVHPSSLSRRSLIGGSLALPLLSGAAQAAAPRRAPSGYPDKLIRIVVPNPAGGGDDVVIRKLSEIVSRQIGQAIVVENVPGASGSIGTGQVARARADGYTLVSINPTYSYFRYIYKTLPWTPEQDVQPITTLLRTPVVIVVAGNSPYATLQDLIADARARPEGLFYGTGGNGSPPHLMGEAFQQTSGTRLTHVPYKGAAEVILGILSGSVTLMVAGIPSFTSYLRSGSLRALAIASTDGKRSPAFPGVPTFTEAGLPRLDNVVSWTWTGIAAPAGTPPEVLQFLQEAYRRAQQSPDYQDYLQSQASLTGGVTSSTLAQQTRIEQTFWQQVTQKAGIVPQ